MTNLCLYSTNKQPIKYDEFMSIHLAYFVTWLHKFLVKINGQFESCISKIFRQHSRRALNITYILIFVYWCVLTIKLNLFFIQYGDVILVKFRAINTLTRKCYFQITQIFNTSNYMYIRENHLENIEQFAA